MEKPRYEMYIQVRIRDTESPGGYGRINFLDLSSVLAKFYELGQQLKAK